MSKFSICIKFLCSGKRALVVAALIAVLVIGITVGILVGSTNRYKGAVVSNGWKCAEIGGKLLEDGGSAVDAAIATLLCEGVVVPQSSGVGGGFVAIIYTESQKKIETIIARERAPAKATKDLLVGKKVGGPTSVGIPGELLGYWEMHQKHGRLPWKKLFEPTIKLCTEGILVSGFLERTLKTLEKRIREEPTMSEIFVKKDGSLYEKGDYMTRPQLAKTLQIIANNGISELYGGGELGKLFAEDMQKLGGIITEQDLKDYKVSWMSNNHTKAKISDYYTLYTTPLPTGGPLLAFMINVMKELDTDDENIYWQRVIETFKHAYGRRSRLGDLEYDPETKQSILETINEMKNEHFIKIIRSRIHDDKTSLNISYYGAKFSVESDKGSSNIAVLAPNGDAVTATSTMNAYFGAQIRSRQTGIVLNNQMDDFSMPGKIDTYGIPSSPTNYMQPLKRPMSSMCPSIILDDQGQARLLVGGAGGTKITTSVATTILRYLVLRESIGSAIDHPRIHHQLLPMEIDFEAGGRRDLLNYLEKVGHKLNILTKRSSYAAVTAIGYRKGEASAHFDARRRGSVYHI